MPRKKTVQPEPLESIYTNERTIEIRNRFCWEIGRGEIEKYESINFQIEFLDHLITRLTRGSRKDLRYLIDLLEGPRKIAEIARLISIWDGGTLSDRTYRRHAEKVREHWTALRKAGAKLDFE